MAARRVAPGTPLKARHASPRRDGPSPVPHPHVGAGRYDPALNHVLGGTMRRATTALSAAAVFALAGCSSSSEPEKPAVTTTATVTATPPLSHAGTMRLCSVAVSEEAPGWEDWNIDLGSWQGDPRTPEACQPLADEEFPPRGNRAFQDALIDGLEMADDPRAEQ